MQFDQPQPCVSLYVKQTTETYATAVWIAGLVNKRTVPLGWLRRRWNADVCSATGSHVIVAWSASQMHLLYLVLNSRLSWDKAASC